MINYIVPCLFGLESIVADELRFMGYEVTEVKDGRVSFVGDENACADVNIRLRCGERLLIQVAEFEARTFEELFQGVKDIEWENYIGRDDSFPVKGHSIKSTLFSIPDCQSIIKKAVVERLKSKYNISWFAETGTKYQIQFSIMKDLVTVMIDTTGVALHKRGYRPVANEAPIRETLAAAMVKLSRYRKWDVLWDPCCGSGTIAIEGAMMAANIAPGLNRSFDAESFAFIPKDAWKQARAKALEAIDKNDVKVYASDIDPKAVELTRQCSSKAGVAECIKIFAADLRDASPVADRGIIICNPPYGERMMELKEAEELYRAMGASFKRFDGWKYYIISSHEGFEALFGKKADKKRKMYNGMIKCNLYQYFKLPDFQLNK